MPETSFAPPPVEVVTSDIAGIGVMDSGISTSPEVTRPIPASEVFVSQQERQGLIKTAMNDGTISTRLQVAADEKADIALSMNIGDSDIDTTNLQDKSGYVHGPKEIFEFVKPDEIYKKVGDLVDKRVEERVEEEDNWYLLDPTTAEACKNGIITQMYDLDAGIDKNIKLINFTESMLSNEQIEIIRQLVERLAGLSGGSIFEGVNAITINSSDGFVDQRTDPRVINPEVIAGTSSGLSKVVRINEKVVNGSFGIETETFNGIEIPLLDALVVHELAHLLEFTDKGQTSEPYSKSVGWESEAAQITDDYGNQINKYIHRLRQPTITVTEDTIPANQNYDQQTIQQAKPVTEYAGKNGREDFAEAVVSYVFTDRDDTRALDIVRRDAIEGVLQRGAVEHGPFHVEVKSTDRTKKIGTKITPRTFIIAEPKFNYQSEANKQIIRANDKKHNATGRTGPAKYVTDDYGYRKVVNYR